MDFLMFLYHLVIFVGNVYCFWYDATHLDEDKLPDRKLFAWRLKYLTCWCEDENRYFAAKIFQTVYFGYCILNDLFGSNLRPDHDLSKRSPLQKFRDFVYASIIFPIGCFVVITFWSLYAIDRELVFPKVLDTVIPAWLNHVMHTTVLPFLLVEMFFVYHHYPSRGKGLAAAVGMTLLYQIWVLWIAFYAGIWVYPVLQVLSWPGRLGFFGVLWVFMISLYIVGEKLNGLIWGRASVGAERLKQR